MYQKLLGEEKERKYSLGVALHSAQCLESSSAYEIAGLRAQVTRHLTKRVEKFQAASQSQFQARDVRFYFPALDLELWADSFSLSAASPYFKTLLSSEFREGSRTTQPITQSLGKRTRAESAEVEDPDDSDDETDQQFRKDATSSPSLRLSSSNAPSASTSTCTSTSNSIPSLHPFHSIDISSAAFTTYTAVLCWLETGHIKFTPLRSNFVFPPPSSTETGQEHLPLQTSSFPFLPLPASPKSVYRLAHFLELPALQRLALTNFKSQLSVSNVLLEVITDVSAVYPEIKDAAFEFAMSNWGEVKKSEGLKKVRAMMENDELASSVCAVVFKLAF